MRIVLSDTEFEQDIRALVKAFFPRAEQSVELVPEAEEASAKVREVAECAVAEKASAKAGKDAVRAGVTASEEASAKVREVAEPVLDVAVRENGAAFTVYYTDESGSKTAAQGVVPPEVLRLPDAHRSVRNQLARAIYQLLSEATGIRLPWGFLTGIRPIKLIYEKLEQGAAEPEILAHMSEEYRCSAEKAELGLSIAKTERRLLQQLPYQNGYSLYIGIPFCPTTCAYCSFPSYPLEKYGELVEAYLNALYQELSYFAEVFPDKELHTVYFGGGTPTTLSAEQLSELLRFVRQRFDCTRLRELTVEAGRPDSITMEKLIALKEAGVTRISVNPQSMNPETLVKIGRRHTVEQVEEAFLLARKAGHDNINMDLIMGLATETPEDAARTLSRIGALAPDSLTVHTLAKKRAARLVTDRKLAAEPDAEGVSEMLALAADFARTHGYAPYYLYRQKNMTENLENVGYARQGKEGLYNILIMEEKQTILAAGAGASSKFIFQRPSDEPDEERTRRARYLVPGVRIERVENVKSLTDYINRIEELIGRKRDWLKRYQEQL